MNHEFTDEQIIRAIKKVFEARGMDYLGIEKVRRDLESFKEIIDALPDPVSDDWQECAFEDIQKGDRVKVVKQNGDYMVFTAESVDRLLVHGEDCHVAHTTTATLYRLPAPVQHPDPKEHPVIYVKDCDGVNFIPKIMVWYRDAYVRDRQVVTPEKITDWTPIDPAKVVAVDE